MKIFRCKSWVNIGQQEILIIFTSCRALEALRKKEISANKASKVYKIPSSTLYKIARKEGIELAQPFNAVATAWNQVSWRGLRGLRFEV